MKWKEKVSLVSMRHNDSFNVSILDKKTLKIYHVMEDLLKIYAEFWKKIRKKVLIICQKNVVHQNISYIARLRHFERQKL